MLIKFWDTRQKEAMTEEIAGPHICGEGIDARGNEISNSIMDTFKFTSNMGLSNDGSFKNT